MKDINVNSMDYRKLSKEEKLKVVKLKINELLKSTDKNKVYEYYNGKKVGVPKDKIGIFKDLCEREKSLEKYVSVSVDEKEEKVHEAEIVETNKKSSGSNIDNMDLDEVNKRIKYIKKYLYEITNLYKKDEYKTTKIIKIQGYNNEYVYIPYSKLGDYKTLYKYLKLLENRKRQLESIEVKKSEVITEKKEVSYEYLTEDENPYETGYMQFATCAVRKDNSEVKVTSEVKPESNSVKTSTETKSSSVKTSTEVKSDKSSIKPNNECKELMVIDNKEKKKTSIGKKILGVMAGLSIVQGICKGAKWLGDKIKDNKIYNKTKNKINEFSEMLRRNKVRTAICALVLAATATVCSFLPKSSSKKNKPDDIVKPTSIVEVTEPSTKEDDIIIEEPVIEEPAKEVEENKEYTLGDSVNIKDNSYIYTNSYDATDKVNNYTPYFDGSYDREVMGVTYELDGNLYTIYKNEINANEKVNELISKGAKQTAVLVVRSDLVNTGEYEGYYNVSSLKRVKTK